MTQLQLFSSDTPLEIAQRAIGRFRNEVKETARFTQAILARLRAVGPRGLVIAACSPAVDQRLLLDDFLRSAIGVPDGSPPPTDGIVRVVAPPDTLGLAAQLATLHERYRLHRLRMPARALADRPLVMHATTETEALAEMLIEVRATLVCVERAENLVSSGAGGARAKVMRHVADIAYRSGVPHLLVGVRETMLPAAQDAALPLPLPTVAQRLYDPAADTDVAEFASILKFCDAQLKDCCDATLASFAPEIIKLVGGDPCRLACWVSLAACQAMRRGSPRLEWDDLEATAGEIVGSAAADLASYLAFTRPPPLPFGPKAR